MNALAASSGVTVFTSIHQPSSQVFEQFSQLLLLHDGRVCYSGARDEAVAYFGALDKSCVCPAEYNPSDFFMALLVEEGKLPQGKLEAIQVRNITS